MKLPELNPTRDQIRNYAIFQGYNGNLFMQDGEWSDMQNMTNDYFPVLANRMKRGLARKIDRFMGMMGGKDLSFVDDNDLYYADSFVTRLEPTNAERQLVQMGAYLCVFPDGVIYNTHTGEITTMEQHTETIAPPTVTICKMDGTKYTNVYSGNTEPTDKTKYWIDTSQDTVVMKAYSDSLAMWVSIPTTYLSIESPGIGEGLKPYDAATFAGLDEDKVYNKQTLNRSNIIYDCGPDYVVIQGLINNQFTNSQNITIDRKKPQMDYVCESDNRIWGCSSDNHEIYACKMGDPQNWYCYAGLDSDSYALTIGTEGRFTGCISYAGTVLFFKENGIHKMYGNKPSNYEAQWKAGRGIQRGSEKSLAIVGDYLMFKSRDGVCVYDGSINVVSAKLGTITLYDAVGGGYRDKYYVSMRDKDYNYFLYVYDTKKATWCKEDAMHAVGMAYTDYGLNIIDHRGNLHLVNAEIMYTKLFPEEDMYPANDLYPGDTATGDKEGDFEWYAITPDMGMDSPYKKYVKRLNLRFSLEPGAQMYIEVMYDSTGNWKRIGTFYATRKRGYDVPVSVRRADHIKIKIGGRGEFRLYSLTQAIEGGSGR